jgi:hypothetical protein
MEINPLPVASHSLAGVIDVPAAAWLILSHAS